MLITFPWLNLSCLEEWAFHSEPSPSRLISILEEKVSRKTRDSCTAAQGPHQNDWEGGDIQPRNERQWVRSHGPPHLINRCIASCNAIVKWTTLTGASDNWSPCLVVFELCFFFLCTIDRLCFHSWHNGHLDYDNHFHESQRERVCFPVAQGNTVYFHLKKSLLFDFVPRFFINRFSLAQTGYRCLKCSAWV